MGVVPVLHRLLGHPGRARRSVGFGNYTAILTSAQVHQRALTTLVYVVGAVTLQTVLGFGIAYLISRRTHGRGVLTTLFLVPMMLSPVVVGLFWRFMLDAQFGVINSMLGSLGLGPVEWLTRQRTALISLIVVDTWQWTPFIMLIALAGLTAVPKYLYEAASIDRASEWFRFRTITLPLVWPLLLIAVLFRAIEAFRLFDLVYILTNGARGSPPRRCRSTSTRWRSWASTPGPPRRTGSSWSSSSSFSRSSTCAT